MDRLDQQKDRSNRWGRAMVAIGGELEKRRAELIRKLVEKDCEETRGRIKELEYMLALPESLLGDINQAELSANNADSVDELGLPE